MTGAPSFPVDIVYAMAEEPYRVTIKVPSGCDVKEAILLSDLLTRFPNIELATAPIGIFSRRVQLSQQLQAFDRVEIYCPLLIEPKQARRLRVERKRAPGKKRFKRGNP
jgi:uncharacterized protein